MDSGNSVKRPGAQVVKEMTISRFPQSSFIDSPAGVSSIKTPNINGALDLHSKLDLHDGFVMHQPLSSSIISAKHFSASCFSISPRNEQ